MPTRRKRRPNRLFLGHSCQGSQHIQVFRLTWHRQPLFVCQAAILQQQLAGPAAHFIGASIPEVNLTPPAEQIQQFVLVLRQIQM